MSDRPVGRHPLPSELLHDLRTPLNHIIGYSELLIEEAEGAHADMLPHLQKVHAAGHHLLKLINDNLEPVRSDPAEAVSAPAPDAPQEPPIRTAMEEIVIDPSAAARGSLLVVDDVEGNRDLLIRRLEREGYAVAAADSGAHALETLHAYTFDVVLLDIMMPEMDGFEVLRRIRDDERLRDVALIVVSAISETDMLERCIELGANDFVSKPFNWTLLRARVGACLEAKRARDREAYLLEQLRENTRKLKALGG